MAQSGQIVSIYNSRNNILEYLKYQKFNIDEDNNFSINEIYSMYQNKQLDMLVERKEDIENKITKKKAYVKYHLAKTLRENNIYDYIEDLYNLEQILTKDDDLIIVIEDTPNDTIIKTIRQIWARDKQFITIFNIKILQFNILKHVLVPTHTVLSNDEEIELRRKFNILNDSELPDISRFDNVAMAIGIRPGQICKIVRPSRTAITSNFYRICSA
jgi:DNA-directed RNA polymerase subunit H (RpoH/RPB5)